MKRGEPFSGDFPGTAEEYVIKHLRLPEKLFLALMFGWAACGPLACAHEVRPVPQNGLHTVAACLDACPGASAVITANVPERGQLCRCWAPNAFSYTFTYPEKPEEFDYARLRWNTGIKAANQCKARESIVCVKEQSEEEPLIDPLKHAALKGLQRELDEILRQTRAEFESTHATPHASLHGRNRPPPKWLLLTPWESWRPKVWRRSA